MKPIYVIVALLIVGSLSAIYILPSTSAKENSLNLVDDIEPMVEEDVDYVHRVHDRLREAHSPQEMQIIIEENPWVTTRVAMYARNLRHIPEDAVIDSIIFAFGSANASAQNINKEWFEGKITEELVAFIFYDGSREPKGVIVRCLNGIIVGLDELQRVGNQMPVFTIAPGEGINHHVQFQTAIDLAEAFNLPLYQGRIMKEEYLITPNEARGMEQILAEKQVTVFVEPGDQFNLGNMTLNGVSADER